MVSAKILPNQAALHVISLNQTESICDKCIPKYLTVINQLKQGNYSVAVPAPPADEASRLGEALQELANNLEAKRREWQQLEQVTTDINAGLLLDQVLERVYHNFRGIIPFNRIGFALIESHQQQLQVRAHWAKSDQPHLRIKQGYTSPLAGSSLEIILNTGQPRIINDLGEYLAQKPTSDSTRLIVLEGMHASLTCPLIVQGVPIGFIFFSSTIPKVYTNSHVEIFQKIASQLSVIVEKGRLMSELTAQKAAIEQQNEQLYHLNNLKNKFLGMAAHDLRGPLGNIHLAAVLLAESGSQLPSDQAISLLHDIAEQASYMSNLVNELLDVTQIESGKLNVSMEFIDLESFLSQAVERHRQLAAPKGTQIHLIKCPTGQVPADPTRLRQVIDNLICNAVKFSPPGSLVRVWVEPHVSGWLIAVQDNGPGITPEDRQHLFQEFARLSAQPTGGEKGIGLGLSIAQRIVEAHKGQIGVDSEPGWGATFWFTLPASFK